MLRKTRSVKEASISPKSTPGSRSLEDRLRLGLLSCALLANFFPVYQFVGSMIWFRHYLGDFQVFWGVTNIPVGQIYDHHVFAYPPTALMLLLPFGVLPFWLSLVAWSAAGVMAVSGAAKRIMSPSAIALGFFTYAGIGVVLGGQISLFVGAAIMIALSSSQPRLRGALLAAAALVKPQSLLAAPIVLLAERNWKGLAWAVGVGFGLVLTSVLFFGADLWLRWLSELPKFHAYLISRGIDRMDVGIYGLARSAGLPGWTFLITLPLGIGTSWLVFRSETPMLDRYAAFTVSSVLMSPYTMYYDLAGLTFACVALLLDRERSPLIWLAAAMIVSSVFASLGIVLLATMLAFQALRGPTGRITAPAKRDRPTNTARFQASVVNCLRARRPRALR